MGLERVLCYLSINTKASTFRCTDAPGRTAEGEGAGGHLARGNTYGHRCDVQQDRNSFFAEVLFMLCVRYASSVVLSAGRAFEGQMHVRH